MRIADLTSFYSPSGGGVRTYIHQKMEYLRSHDEVDYSLIMPGDDTSVSQEDGASIYTVRGFPVDQKGLYRQLSDVGTLVRLLGEIKPDVVEIGSPYLDPWLALISKLNFPHRLVGFYHADVPDTYVAPATKFWPSLARDAVMGMSRRYIRFTHNQFDATVATSPVTLRKLEEMGVENLHLVPLGADTDTFRPGRRSPALRRSLGLRRKDQLALYVGRFREEKGLPVLLQAAQYLEKLDHVHVAFVGTGPMDDEVRALCARNERCHYIGYVGDRDEMAELYAAADVLINPCPYETFGLATLEALSSGLPVLTPNTGGAGYLAQASQAGMTFSPQDALDLLEKLDRLLRSDLRLLSSRARSFSEGFSWQNTFDKLFSLYKELTDATASRSAVGA